jgi:aspartate 1-decarboxylase
MLRSMLKSKLHRLKVTAADLDYEGSITLDPALLKAADILPFEAVHVWNITQGTRFQTYAMQGEPGTGVVCINGAAARLTKPGDLIIVATFVDLEDAAAKKLQPKIVLVDGENRVRQGSNP